jgi:hypothetical protein
VFHSRTGYGRNGPCLSAFAFLYLNYLRERHGVKGSFSVDSCRRTEDALDSRDGSTTADRGRQQPAKKETFDIVR